MLGTGLDELGTLGQEAVARMDRIAVRRQCRRDELVDTKVRVSRSGRSNLDGTIGETHVHRVLVGRRVDGDRLDPELAASPNNPDGDLAPVCNEAATQHRWPQAPLGSISKSGWPYSTADASSTRIFLIVPAVSALNSLKSFMASRMHST